MIFKIFITTQLFLLILAEKFLKSFNYSFFGKYRRLFLNFEFNVILYLGLTIVLNFKIRIK